MPLLQLGTAQLITKTGIDSTVPEQFTGMVPERAYRQIELALQNGIRAFDTALIYRSHIPIGHVLGEWFRTGLHRNDVWIQTKVFHPNATQMTFGISHMPTLQQMTPEQVSKQTLEHVETSLLQLNIGYVDLLLLHWPSGLPEAGNDVNINTDSPAHNNDINWSLNNESNNRQRRIAAWKVLEQIYEKGWARAIGVSNFSVKHLQQLVEDDATILPMVNQIEASVTLQYTDVVEYCIQNNIVPQAYSPFGRGLTEMPLDVLSSMVQQYGRKDFGQISVKYLLQLGYSVVYLSNSPERMVSNMDVFDFNLSRSDMNILQHFHRPHGGWGLPAPNQLA
jgi:diketogulonate reductase-like aldo/keto reductase